MIPDRAADFKRRGKWSQPGVPHRGWTCTGIEDLEEPQLTCEMCESQVVRYVHYMRHPDFPEVMGVGVVCAGHMEEDLAAARVRESFMQSRARKRKKWLDRRWRESKNGNPWIKADGYRVTIYPREKGWATVVSDEGNSFTQHSKKEYPSQCLAKLEAFDMITRRQSAALHEK